jgi:hypothetical protein
VPPRATYPGGVRGYRKLSSPHGAFSPSTGLELRLIPTPALARTREAMHKSLEEERSQERAGGLALLKIGLTQTWHDPLVSGTHDAQELSKTHHRVALARTRVWLVCAIITFSCISLRSNTSSARTVGTG